MKRIMILAAALAVLAGCAIQSQPESRVGSVYRTPINGASAQVVVSQAFQTMVIRQKPTVGQSWSMRTFEIPVGKPLTESIVTQIRGVVPTARIGDRDDGAPAAVTIIPQDVALQFGVDDGKAVNTIALAGVFGAGSKAEVMAEVALSASIIDQNGSSRLVTVAGKAARQQALLSVTQGAMTEVIGEALDDAATKLVLIAEESLRGKAP